MEGQTGSHLSVQIPLPASYIRLLADNEAGRYPGNCIRPVWPVLTSQKRTGMYHPLP